MSSQVNVLQTPLWTATPTAGTQINSSAVSDNGEVAVVGTSSEYDSGDFSVFCYDQTGALKWQQPIADQRVYQGVFWVAVSGNGQIAAAGGETSKSGSQRGFLNVYSVSSGEVLYSAKLPSRVNQICLSQSGLHMLVAYGDSLQLYTRQNNTYVLTDTETFEGQSCNSCALSSAGNMAAASVVNYHDSDTASTLSETGRIVAYYVLNDRLKVALDYPVLVATMRVAMSADGEFFGASLHNGHCIAFDSTCFESGQCLWQFAPAGYSLSVAYGIAVARDKNGDCYLACGANLYTDESAPATAPLGVLYLVKSKTVGSSQHADLQWCCPIQYSPNPGVNMDVAGTYVTATDGAPDFSHSPTPSQESPGNFYLFDRQAGMQIGQYQTSQMNWPMAITANGQYLFGASDNGTAYYWKTADA
ncbi:hypothetical protein [Echinimonas agarilytica]|uniref:Uncharacterized protein n=1 Tax=Echinimonas agarilytica TaxID=1215918 RepID=A0AA41W3F2_9GAMM|nr:hypothetical protein [Echinimonas agarilytica]MCM2678137.1 hypothetical protein [Echinimonas agarilytica]